VQPEAIAAGLKDKKRKKEDVLGRARVHRLAGHTHTDRQIQMLSSFLILILCLCSFLC
jgi:hypothetical protein